MRYKVNVQSIKICIESNMTVTNMGKFKIIFLEIKKEINLSNVFNISSRQWKEASSSKIMK